MGMGNGMSRVRVMVCRVFIKFVRGACGSFV